MLQLVFSFFFVVYVCIHYLYNYNIAVKTMQSNLQWCIAVIGMHTCNIVSNYEFVDLAAIMKWGVCVHVCVCVCGGGWLGMR